MEIIQENNNVLSELISLTNWVRDEIEKGASISDIERDLAVNKQYESVTIINVTEMANIDFNAKTKSGPTVGDANSHVDQFIDEDGNQVGSMTGSGWKIAALPDNSVVSYYHETADTALGRIETSGIWNSSAIWASQWQSLLAVGVSGDVMGKVGIRQLFQEIPREKYRTLIVLVPLNQIKSLLQ